jgi:hypothetical protein
MDQCILLSSLILERNLIDQESIYEADYHLNQLIQFDLLSPFYKYIIDSPIENSLGAASLSQIITLLPKLFSSKNLAGIKLS